MLELVLCFHRLVIVVLSVLLPMRADASRSLTRPEQRYCVTRKELLAVVEFVHHFRQYLLGREFTLRTDRAWISGLDPEF